MKRTEAELIDAWERGNKRGFNGLTYLTKKDRRIAYKAWLDAKSPVR